MNEEKKFHNSKSHALALFLSISLPLILILVFTFRKYEDFQLLSEMKKNNVIKSHANISDILHNKTYITALEKQTDTLSTEEVKASVEELYSYDIGEYALFYNGELVSSTYPETDSRDAMLLMEHSYSEECFLEEYEKDSSYYIKSVSKIKLMNNDYILITTNDVSDLHNLKKKMTTQIIVYGIVGICVLILLSVIFARHNVQHLNDTAQKT